MVTRQTPLLVQSVFRHSGYYRPAILYANPPPPSSPSSIYSKCVTLLRLELVLGTVNGEWSLTECFGLAQAFICKWVNGAVSFFILYIDGVFMIVLTSFGTLISESKRVPWFFVLLLVAFLLYFTDCFDCYSDALLTTLGHVG